MGIRFLGANPKAPMVAEGELASVSNYFLGNDQSKWRTQVAHKERVRVKGAYPGIDVIWYGNGEKLEYDLMVAPGADPSRIALQVEGAQSLEVDAKGDLLIHTRMGDLTKGKPVIYQDLEGRRVSVEGRYAILGKDRIGFQLNAYDQTHPLVIDPTLAYSTYLGGFGDDFGTGVAVDSVGNAYVTGYSLSTNFPTLDATRATSSGGREVFVTKLAANGALVYSTYLGGSFTDQAFGIAVDSSSAVYVVGLTNSTNFPTLNSFQSVFGGGTYDAFVAKLSANGALAYSTYFGGTGRDYGYGIAVDSSGNAFLTGDTTSLNFPIMNSTQALFRGGALMPLLQNLRRLVP